jgi:hypothetical protein
MKSARRSGRDSGADRVSIRAPSARRPPGIRAIVAREQYHRSLNFRRRPFPDIRPGI